MDRARHRTLELSGQLRDIPLRVHARYQREEILAALDYATPPTPSQQLPRRRAVLKGDRHRRLLRDTHTSRKRTTPPPRCTATTPSARRCSTGSLRAPTSVASATGQRYINHRALGSNILIFAREQKLNELGTSPYLFLGPATYTTHTGDRPIAITWRLDHPMPTDIFQAASVVA